MKNKKKLLLVSHCILNVRSKIQYAVEFETEEERNRKAFLKKVIEEDIQLMQLPCPEFLMYGGRRWGHSSEQFDNPFFRRQARKMLEDIVLQEAMGIFMQVLKEMLEEEGIILRMVPLTERTLEELEDEN